MNYLSNPIRSTQARLRDRTVLVPDIDLSAFRKVAVIDFIQLRFAIGRNSQFQHIQDLAEIVLDRRCYVTPLFAEPGGSTRAFDIKIHDPTMKELVELCRLIDAGYKFTMLPIVSELEVSVDFYPIKPDDVLRIRMLKTLENSFLPMKDLFASGEDRPRFTWGREKDQTKFPIFWKEGLSPEEASFFEMSADEDRSPAVDATFYVGKKDADSAWRIMDKILDRQNHAAHTRTELAEKERRVRIEVTLQRPELDGLGLTYLSDLKTFSFTTLQRPYFSFWLPTFNGVSSNLPEIRRGWLDGMRRDKFRNTGAIGLLRMDRAWDDYRKEQRKMLAGNMHRAGLSLPTVRRTGSGDRGTLVAYKEMNGAVSSALERLGLRVANDFRRAFKLNGDVWFMR